MVMVGLYYSNGKQSKTLVNPFTVLTEHIYYGTFPGETKREQYLQSSICLYKLKDNSKV